MATSPARLQQPGTYATQQIAFPASGPLQQPKSVGSHGFVPTIQAGGGFSGAGGFSSAAGAAAASAAGSSADIACSARPPRAVNRGRCGAREREERLDASEDGRLMG